MNKENLHPNIPHPKISAFLESATQQEPIENWRRLILRPSQQEQILEAKLDAMLRGKMHEQPRGRKIQVIRTSMKSSSFSKYYRTSTQDSIMRSQKQANAEIMEIAALAGKLSNSQMPESNDSADLLEYIRCSLEEELRKKERKEKQNISYQ